MLPRVGVWEVMGTRQVEIQRQRYRMKPAHGGRVESTFTDPSRVAETKDAKTSNI